MWILIITCLHNLHTNTFHTHNIFSSQPNLFSITSNNIFATSTRNHHQRITSSINFYKPTMLSHKSDHGIENDENEYEDIKNV